MEDVRGTRPPIDSGYVRDPEDSHSLPDSDSDPEIVKKSDTLRAETFCPTGFTRHKGRRFSPPEDNHYDRESYEGSYPKADNYQRYRSGSYEPDEDEFWRYKSAETGSRPHIVRDNDVHSTRAGRQRPQGSTYEQGLHEQAANDARRSSYGGSEDNSYPHMYIPREHLISPSANRRRRRTGSDDSESPPPMMVVPRPR